MLSILFLRSNRISEAPAPTSRIFIVSSGDLLILFIPSSLTEFPPRNLFIICNSFKAFAYSFIIYRKIVHQFFLITSLKKHYTPLRIATSIVNPGPKATAQHSSSILIFPLFRSSFNTKRIDAEDRFP